MNHRAGACRKTDSGQSQTALAEGLAKILQSTGALAASIAPSGDIASPSHPGVAGTQAAAVNSNAEAQSALQLLKSDQANMAGPSAIVSLFLKNVSHQQTIVA